MRALGWYLQPQLSFDGLPPNLHLTLTPATVGQVDALVEDLGTALGAARALPPVTADPALVGFAARLDPAALGPDEIAAVLAFAGLDGDGACPRGRRRCSSCSTRCRGRSRNGSSRSSSARSSASDASRAAGATARHAHPEVRGDHRSMAGNSTATRDGAAVSRAPRQKLALAAMLFAVSMTFIDQTIVSIAAPNITAELGLSASGMQWVVNAYLLSLAAFFALGGRLSDIFGHRRVMLIGTLLFVISSALCGCVPSGDFALTWLIIFRATQGLGAALMFRRRSPWSSRSSRWSGAAGRWPCSSGSPAP